MINISRTDIIGNVGTVGNLRFSQGSKPVMSFSVAVNRKYKDKDDEIKEQTEWFNVIVWNKLAENCNKYVAKGQLVYVSGRVSLHEWEKQDKFKGHRLDLHANSVVFLNRPNSDVSGIYEVGDYPF